MPIPQQTLDGDLICIHLWNTVANTEPGTGPYAVHPEPVVLAVRHLPGEFPSSFSFTPEGQRRQPVSDQQSLLRHTVWIFNGDHARYASAVFETAETGLAWAAEHRATGILAEYTYGGTYDAAVREGRFTPSKPHHGTADHIAGFGPGLRHIHMTDGQRD